MPRKQQSAHRGKTRGKPAAKTRTKTARAGKAKPSGRAKPSAGAKPSAARRTTRGAKAMAKSEMRPLAVSSVAPPDLQIAKLYELVCDVEGRMQDGLKLGACHDLANAHLGKHPDHDCDCFRQGTSDDAITKRFRDRAAVRDRAAARAVRAR
ncbi:MAG TPA: hypothetical protein VHT91_18085 [Kofleriaceae bacterium]|jgi:membrane-bound lytic murein transglycosylase|nr:hypothetical protein [Kofleriaceae bacterium]